MISHLVSSMLRVLYNGDSTCTGCMYLLSEHALLVALCRCYMHSSILGIVGSVIGLTNRHHKWLTEVSMQPGSTFHAAKLEMGGTLARPIVALCQYQLCAHACLQLLQLCSLAAHTDILHNSS